MCNHHSDKSYRRGHHKHGHHHRRHGGAGRYWKHRMATAFGQPPVNIEERDTDYEIKLFAAGYEKSDFQIAIENDYLIVSVEKEESSAPNDWMPLKYRPGSFVQEFKLNEKIDTDNIAAQYINGVLIITLPKVQGTETVRQEVKVN